MFQYRSRNDSSVLIQFNLYFEWRKSRHFVFVRICRLSHVHGCLGLFFSVFLHPIFFRLTQCVVNGVARERHTRFHVDLRRFNVLTHQCVKHRLICNQIRAKSRCFMMFQYRSRNDSSIPIQFNLYFEWSKSRHFVFVIQSRLGGFFRAYFQFDTHCAADIHPAAHITLVSIIVACRDDCSVRFQAYRPVITCRNGHNICPIAHITLAITIVARRDDRAIRFQAYRVIPPRRDNDDIPPAAHVAFIIPIVARRDNRSVRFHAYRVSSTCRNSNNVRPVTHFTLFTITIF